MTEIVTTEQSHPIEVHQPPPPEPQRERYWGAEEIYQGAGKLDVDAATMAILMAPIDESMVCIRPDGIVYLPWAFFADRLRRAFALSWALVAGDKPVLEGNQVIWLNHLRVRGCYVSSSYGQCNYHANNRGMSYGDAIEGAKSDALTRCCKPLGIAAELWDPAFLLQWKKKWAEAGGSGGYGGSKWRKRKAEDVGWDQAFLNRVDDLNAAHFEKQKTIAHWVEPPVAPSHSVPEPSHGASEPNGTAVAQSHTVARESHGREAELKRLKGLMKESMSKHGIKRQQWREAIGHASAGRATSFPDLNKWSVEDAEALLLVFEGSGEALAKELQDKEPENDGG